MYYVCMQYLLKSIFLVASDVEPFSGKERGGTQHYSIRRGCRARRCAPAICGWKESWGRPDHLVSCLLCFWLDSSSLWLSDLRPIPFLCLIWIVGSYSLVLSTFHWRDRKNIIWILGRVARLRIYVCIFWMDRECLPALYFLYLDHHATRFH
jgi:hypothetical protein